jgi:hypothetical protein
MQNVGRWEFRASDLHVGTAASSSSSTGATNQLVSVMEESGYYDFQLVEKPGAP